MVDAQRFKVVGFFCNWCSYAGADLAGNLRLSIPAELRIIRIPCTGRMDPLFVIKALLDGADGVIVSGCHPGDCHYREGNYYARRRLALFNEILPVLGIEPERFMFTWKSASEGREIQSVVEEFVEALNKVGKMDPRAFSLLDAATLTEIKDAGVAGLEAIEEKVES